MGVRRFSCALASSACGAGTRRQVRSRWQMRRWQVQVGGGRWQKRVTRGHAASPTRLLGFMPDQ
eukprot:6545575-Prymnesium_polylepis.1